MTASLSRRQSSTWRPSTAERHPSHRRSDVDGVRAPGIGRWASGRRGFTVIELLIVVTLVGLMVAVAAPRIDVQRFKVNGAVHALGSTILAAQRQAVTQQHNVIILFDSSSNRIRVHEDRNNDAAINTGEHVRAVPLGEGIVFGRGTAPAMAFGSSSIAIVKRISSQPALVFHRDGSASEVGGFYVTSQAAQGGANRPRDARAVSVQRATGRASWFRYETTGWVKLF